MGGGQWMRCEDGKLRLPLTRSALIGCFYGTLVSKYVFAVTPTSKFTTVIATNYLLYSSYCGGSISSCCCTHASTSLTITTHLNVRGSGSLRNGSGMAFNILPAAMEVLTLDVPPRSDFRNYARFWSRTLAAISAQYAFRCSRTHRLSLRLSCTNTFQANLLDACRKWPAVARTTSTHDTHPR